jgi:23S rRNA (uracil1939-C5)-methyltransferase
VSGRSRRVPRTRPAGGHRFDPDPVTVHIGAAMAAGGDALGRLADGRVVFVEGALPGEVVGAVLVEDRRDFARARATSIETSSPHRVDPPCRWARAGCGGCQWQHATPAAQLAQKAAIVADSLARIARVTVPAGPPPVALGPDGYRTTLRLAVDGEGRPALRHRHSRDTVGVDGCLVAHPLLADLMAGTRLRPGVGEVTLRVGVAGGERLVLPSSGAVVVEAPVDAVVARSTDPAVLHEDAGGRRWRVSGGAFFQSGPAAASLLASTVDRAAGPIPAGGTVIDLYAGVGLLGGVVASRSGASLTAVESSPEAAADAVANLADLDATVVVAEVGEWEPVVADVVLADPARSGLGRPGVEAVAATGAGRVVLVSCDPASGARDTALLVAAGYDVREVAVLDLFPHTFHVESVSTFERP